MPAIRMRGVGKRFGERWAVRDLDLDVGDGETVALIGPSGCGKTTTLRMANRLLEPDSGSIEVLGEDIRVADPAELRRGIGYVIQEVGLFAHYTVRDNVAVVPELLGWRPERTAARVRELLKLVGLSPDEYAARHPRQLSGGERQRVGIARALAADPPLVLLDEPFGALDAITRESLQDEFLSLSRRLGKSCLLVTHDVFEAVRLAHRIVVMKEGRVVQAATPAELVRAPADAFVEALLGRHRHQLRLMTLSLRDALRSLPPGAEPDGAAAVDLAPEQSVWDALDELERKGAGVVEVEDGGQKKRVGRRALLEDLELVMSLDWRSLGVATLEHLELTALAIAIAVVIGVPLGAFLTRERWLSGPVLATVGVIQTVPSLALLGVMVPLLGIGERPALVALFLYALLPIVRSTYSGLESIDPAAIDAARGLGMRDREILRKIALPLALPIVMGGIRTSTVINVGVATLAALVGGGGLGKFIFRGIAMVDAKTVLMGAIPAALLALLLDGLLALLERRLVPEGVREE